MVDFIVACCLFVVALGIMVHFGDFIFLAGLLAGAAWLAYGAYTGAISGGTVGGVLIALLLFKALYSGPIFGFEWTRPKRPSRPASKDTPPTSPTAPPPKRYTDAEFKAVIDATVEKYRAEHQ
ncbi:MAG: hypothetical protein WAK55_19760, partial [Xanthobacteraceae bacterium]